MDSTTRDVRLVPPHRLWQRTSWLLSHAAGRAYRLVVREAGGATARTRYGFLAALEEFGAISQAELSRRLGVDPKEVVGALRNLEADGLIARAPDERDPRRNAVSITPGGRKALRQLDRALDAAHEKLLAPLSPKERGQLDRLLQRLVEHHFGSPGGAPLG
jgi:DNA-binding MarR family transcriptional regulator